MSSQSLLNIMRHYADAKDVAVRRNLCDALVAEGSADSAELLLDLATQDPDASVNAFATEQIAHLSSDQLHAVQPSLARRFSPKKGKEHILNWVRCADQIAKGTHTSLFQGFGKWWKEVRATRKLNRSLLFSRKNEFSFAARLLNRHIVISAILAVLLTWFLSAVLINNPEEDLTIGLPFVAGFSVLLGGIPLALMFAPPDIAFRRSAIAFVDSITVLLFGFCCIVFAAAAASAIGEPIDNWFVVRVVLYLVLPLICVRVALNASTCIKQRLAYPLMLCVVVIGVLVAIYSILLWVLDAINPVWYEYSSIMSLFLWITVPISLFLALHQGSRGNVIGHTGETARTLFFNRIRWRFFVGLGAAFILALAIAPASGVDRPGRGDTIPVILLAGDSEITGDKPLAQLRAEEDIKALETRVVAKIADLVRAAENANANRSLVVYTSEVMQEISQGTSARRLREMANTLLDMLYSRIEATNPVYLFEDAADLIFNLADTIEAMGPSEAVQTIKFQRANRLVFEVQAEGDLDLTARAYRNGRETDVVLWVNGFAIDERSWSDPEVFQDVVGEGRLIAYADTPAQTIGIEEVVSHFQSKIAYVMRRYLFVNMRDRQERDVGPVELEFDITFVWTPKTAPVDK